jgi:hypothetical protein
MEGDSSDNSPIFERKAYAALKEWKERSKGSTAILVEGARRVGKSTLVEEFARKEYHSYVLIDFFGGEQADQRIVR